MAFYKKSKLHTGTALICSLAIVFSALPVYATDTIDNLQNQTSALENELKGINQDILTLSEKISDTEMQVELLNSDIDKTQDDLEKAQKNEDQQYEDMKSRIKYMYEHGSATMLEMLFSAENMSDFLNKADFIENLSNYDRKALNNLKDVHPADCRSESRPGSTAGFHERFTEPIADTADTITGKSCCNFY